MELTRIYIGANNDTKELELSKIKSLMHSFSGVDGYTLIQTLGYWLGNNEPSCIIEIYGKYKPELIQILKTKLKQDSIMVVKDYKVVEFK